MNGNESSPSQSTEYEQCVENSSSFRQPDNDMDFPPFGQRPQMVLAVASEAVVGQQEQFTNQIF